MNPRNHLPALRAEAWESLFSAHSPLRICYAAGEMICQAGSYVAGIHLVTGGVVSERVTYAAGRGGNSRVLCAGDLIGLEILQRSSHELSFSLCRALTAVELLFMERSQVEQALASDARVLPTLLQYAVSQYLQTRKDPRSNAPASAQLARLLLQLGDACGMSADTGTISLPAEITLRALGDLLPMSHRQFRQARASLEGLTLSETGISFDAQKARQLVGDDCLPTG